MSPQIEDDLPDGKVRACPECNATGLRKLKRNGEGREPKHDLAYTCTRCLAPVEEPVIRQSRKGNPAMHRLLDMDPEDVPGLNGGSA